MQSEQNWPLAPFDNTGKRSDNNLARESYKLLFLGHRNLTNNEAFQGVLATGDIASKLLKM